METGVLAHQTPGSKTFITNTASYFIEILKLDSDEPAEAGEPGRGVVTDYFSFAVPLRRYDIGDIVVSRDVNQENGAATMECIIGRSVELIWRTDGSVLSPLVIDDVMDDLQSVQQYQFIQEAEKKYRLKIIAHHLFNSKEKIRKRLNSVLGNDAVISIERVGDIEPLPSGKRPVVKNELMNRVLTI